MNARELRDKIRGVWSACPTPFTNTMKVDTVAVRRMVEHHIRLGVTGLFLAGTTGEGPLLSASQLASLTRTTAKCAKGRIAICVQVTDNSPERILDNIKASRDNGADIAIIAEPYQLLAPSDGTITNLYLDAIKKSPLPVGIYNRGEFAHNPIPPRVQKIIYEQGNVILVKFSSRKPAPKKILLAARRKRPELRILNGDEFNCAESLKEGFDGLLLGGGAFNGCLAGQIYAAVKSGDFAEAERIQERMNRLMFLIYTKKVTGWITGQKQLLVEMGIFRTAKNYTGRQMTEKWRSTIKRVMARNADILFPY